LAIATFACLSTVFPYPTTAEKFFVLAMLGENQTAENYFPNNNPNLHEMEEVNWYVDVENFMQQAQYVLLKVKILNSTMTLPDSAKCQPSPENDLLNVTVFLISGQSKVVAFSWHIADFVRTGEFLTLRRIVVNGVSTGLNVESTNGADFHFLFELWHYDPFLEDFRFSWDSGFGVCCAWNQMIFNINE
jgi:hypothetical protein